MKTIKIIQYIRTQFLVQLFIFSSIFSFGQSFPDRAILDGLIFEGKIEMKESRRSKDQTTIYTINWFKPEKIYGGQIESQNNIPVITAGGKTDEGILVVSHALNFHKGYSYLISLQPCLDCIEGMTVYIPVANIGLFNREKFLIAKNNWKNKIRTAAPDLSKPCDETENAALFISFGSVHLSLQENTIEGYIDVKTKTNLEAKVLYNISTQIKYDTGIFEENAIANQSLDIHPIQIEFEEDYISTASDLSVEEALFSMTKDANAENDILINTFFQPTFRISFTTDLTILSNLPNELSELFEIIELNASYFCDGREIKFNKIKFDNHPIGVIFDGFTESITYSFENLNFNSTTDEYSFTIFASSTSPTVLSLAHIIIDYNTNAFSDFQVTNGLADVLSLQSGTILGDNINYSFSLQDIDEAGILLEVEAGTVSSINDLEVITSTPRAVATMTMEMADCSLDPHLLFRDFDMQEFSQYVDEETFPIPIVYENVIAFDSEFTPGCNCDDDPKINDWTPEEIVAGDNQILTIFGENFGVWQRGSDPGDDGTGSSVLFKNGDYVSGSGGDAPEYVAAAKADFNIDGIIKWSDDEIQVKVPSTDYLQGTHGPAATGRFKVRNGCNEEDLIGVFQELDIPYSKMNYRLDDEGVAKRLGLRNDNGEGGEQDGYTFEYHPNVNSANIDIKEAFEKALNSWCEATEIRFNLTNDEAPLLASANADDGKNIIIVGGLSNPDAQAALVVSQQYFSIDCEGDNTNDEDGGFIMTDLDFVVEGNFAAGNDQDRAERVFTHELGHGHMLNHALCFGFACSGPLMHPQAQSDIKDVDENGGEEIFGDSQVIIDNGCTESSGVIINPMTIQVGNCGIIVSTFEENSIKLSVSPNPTSENIFIPDLTKTSYFSLYNSNGKMIEQGVLPIGDNHISIFKYPSGTYFLKISDNEQISHFKIIKL